MFILAVEEEGKADEYERNPAGVPMLPIFKTGVLSHSELDVIYRILPDYMVNCTNGPVFNDFPDQGEYSVAANDHQDAAPTEEPTNAPPSVIEQWTLTDGTSFEAEFVMEMTGFATFRNAEGKETKVPMDQLTEDSKSQIFLKKPPKIELDLVKDQNQVVFDGGRSERGTGTRSPEHRVHYGLRVFTRSSMANYDFPLNAEVYVIGQERWGQKYIMLDKFDVTFTLTREKHFKYEFMNDRLVVLENYSTFDPPFPRGEDYAGYLAIVKDMRGEEIGVFSSPKFLYDAVANLRQRSVGDFMEKDGTRTFPTRPENTDM